MDPGDFPMQTLAQSDRSVEDGHTSDGCVQVELIPGRPALEALKGVTAQVG
jgi:hypothetical protein